MAAQYYNYCRRLIWLISNYYNGGYRKQRQHNHKSIAPHPTIEGNYPASSCQKALIDTSPSTHSLCGPKSKGVDYCESSEDHKIQNALKNSSLYVLIWTFEGKSHHHFPTMWHTFSRHGFPERQPRYALVNWRDIVARFINRLGAQHVLVQTETGRHTCRMAVISAFITAPCVVGGTFSVRRHQRRKHLSWLTGTCARPSHFYLFIIKFTIIY